MYSKYLQQAPPCEYLTIPPVHPSCPNPAQESELLDFGLAEWNALPRLCGTLNPTPRPIPKAFIRHTPLQRLPYHFYKYTLSCTHTQPSTTLSNFVPIFIVPGRCCSPWFSEIGSSTKELTGQNWAGRPVGLCCWRLVLLGLLINKRKH